ncbi:conserved exported hypothetical protein [Verrucomicrobia bacterium]|nr:conserved exported hypothetical protein [Verrucomicrobiota bacterium]
MKVRFYGIIALALAAAFSAHAQAPEIDKLTSQAQQTINVFEQQFPGWATMFQSSAGYAVFPSVAEGALGVGVMRGKGLLYQTGRAMGEVTLTKASVGAQVGGQTFSEVVFFQTPEAVRDFKAGNYELKAGVSGVASYDGAVRTVNYNRGVAVVTFDRTGLIGKAAVGGQKFSYQPLSPATN